MSKIFQLDQKVALITGAASGIGAAIARVFAAAGARVHLFDQNQAALEAISKEISASGGEAHAHQVDVTERDAMVHHCQKIKDKEDRIDIMICNAGIAQIGRLDNTPEADLERIIAVNIKGVYNSMYAVIDIMKEQRSGVILNMASVSAGLGLSERFGYSLTKGAVVNMTYTVAKDYLDYNIRCNCISPARVHTPFVDAYLSENYPGQEKEMYDQLSKTQPIGRMGRPEEIAYLAQYLCSDAAAFITGTDFPIDGGFIRLNTGR